jgi:hypothetical protein
VLLAVDFHKYFVNVEGVTVASMTKVEPEIEPDSIANNVRGKSVALICIHWPILSAWVG